MGHGGENRWEAEIPASFLRLRQVHGKRLVEVASGLGQEEGDGWLFSRPVAVWAAVGIADCLPVALFSRETGRAAIVHCGYRGLAAGILESGAEELCQGPTFGKTGSFLAWLGPCIGPCCYQVQEDVASSFMDVPAALASHPDSGWWLDLRRVARSRIAAYGGEIAGIVDECTRCHPKLYHSYRRAGAVIGRQFLIGRLVRK